MRATNLISIVRRRLFRAQTLEPRVPLLRLQARAPGARGRAGRPARYGRRRRAADQLDQAFARIDAILRLGAVALRRDHQHAVGGHPPSGEPFEANAHVGRQGRTRDVEAQLDRGRKLVDVLPAGTGRADEAFLEVALVDRDAAGDADHGPAVGWVERSETHRSPETHRWVSPRCARLNPSYADVSRPNRTPRGPSRSRLGAGRRR